STTSASSSPCWSRSTVREALGWADGAALDSAGTRESLLVSSILLDPDSAGVREMNTLLRSRCGSRTPLDRSGPKTVWFLTFRLANLRRQLLRACLRRATEATARLRSPLIPGGTGRWPPDPRANRTPPGLRAPPQTPAPRGSTRPLGLYSF